MKKYLLPLLLVLLLLPVSAFADVIWEPDDDFYWKNSEDCVYVNRLYTGNGSKGYVHFYSDPQSGTLLAAYPNGFQLTVHFSIQRNGKEYGLVEYVLDEKAVPMNGWGETETAWIDMEELSGDYDSKAFRLDYADRIENRQGQIFVEERICLYKYPGSAFSYSYDQPGTAITYSQCFTDEAGREWAYIHYYQWIRDSWVCLSDPNNENIPQTVRQLRELIPPQPVPDTVETNSGSAFLLPLLLVLVLLVLTGLLLLRFRKNKKKEE